VTLHIDKISMQLKGIPLSVADAAINPFILKRVVRSQKTGVRS